MKALKNVLVTTSACSLITIGSAAMAQQDMYYTYKNCPSASLCVKGQVDIWTGQTTYRPA